MREIRFRTWDTEKKEWCINIGVGNILYEIHANKHHDLNDTFILNQFTGLKDKNGNEIYEGDIVKCFDHPTNVDSATSEVFFAQGCFRVKDTICPLADFGTAWTEVIGNIYENPELLNP